MAHELYTKANGESTFIGYQKDAWHKLGTVIQEQIGAVEALKRLTGTERIEYREFPLVPMLTTVDLDGASSLIHPNYWDADSVMGSGQKAIYQFDGNGNPLGLVAVVNEKWELVTPDQAAYAWDGAMAELEATGYAQNAFIETMGFLSKGKVADRFWIATKQQPLEVRGDRIELYVTTYISMSQDSTINVNLTPVRVVCANTWRASEFTKHGKIKIMHSEHAVGQLRGAIQNAYLGLPEGIQGLQDWLEALADTRVSTADVQALAEYVYVLPTEPSKNTWGKMSHESKIIEWERQSAVIKAKRTALLEGFSGGQIGFDTTPGELHGTAYLAFQGVTEIASHHTGRNILRGQLEGTRADEVARAEKWLTKFVNA